jgi:hypothetical protein
MVAAVPQAELTVKEALDLLIAKHGTWRHNMGAIDKKRQSKNPQAPFEEGALTASGNKKQAPPPPPPAMFTLAAAKAVV